MAATQLEQRKWRALPWRGAFHRQDGVTDRGKPASVQQLDGIGGRARLRRRWLLPTDPRCGIPRRDAPVDPGEDGEKHQS